ncbi:MAG: YkgJ family cysteine cluster protein [Candidatus Xenobiia bacterium LiM19]
MEINEGAALELRTNQLLISPGEEGEIVLLYADYPSLRTIARTIASLVVTEYTAQLFHDFCSRCGNCCQARPVKATAGEIARICHHIGESSETAFRKEYIDNAFSWNLKDGFIKKKEGRCIFLQQLSSYRTSCSIHAARPAACARLAPSHPGCCKAKSILISHLKSVTFHGESVELKTHSGVCINTLIENSILKPYPDELRNLLAATERNLPHREEVFLQSLCNRVESIRRGLISNGITPLFYTEMISLNAETRHLNTESMREKSSYSILVEKIRRLQGLTLALTEGAEPEARHRDIVITRLSIRSEKLNAFFLKDEMEHLHSIRYDEHAAVLASVRAMMKHILSFGDPHMWEILWHPDSYCFLCARCCQCMRVEITPVDIERIAGHFALTEEEARARFIFPPIFSWNDADGILAKKDGAPLDRVLSGSDCIFLVHHSPAVALCSIYSARPDVCRGYDSTNRPCIEMSVVLKRDTFLENIITVDISGAHLSIRSVLSGCHSEEPYMLHLREDETLHRLYKELEQEAAAVVLSSYRGTR